MHVITLSYCICEARFVSFMLNGIVFFLSTLLQCMRSVCGQYINEFSNNLIEIYTFSILWLQFTVCDGAWCALHCTIDVDCTDLLPVGLDCSKFVFVRVWVCILFCVLAPIFSVLIFTIWLLCLFRNNRWKLPIKRWIKIHGEYKETIWKEHNTWYIIYVYICCVLVLFSWNWKVQQIKWGNFGKIVMQVNWQYGKFYIKFAIPNSERK